MSERDETREAVARAIYEGRNGKGCAPWSRQSAAHKEPYLKDADSVAQFVEDARKDAQTTNSIGWRKLAMEAGARCRPGSRFTVEGVECVVVPSIPHPDQTAAGWDALDEKSSGVLTEDDVHEDAIDGIYRAMIRACEEKGDG